MIVAPVVGERSLLFKFITIVNMPLICVVYKRPALMVLFEVHLTYGAYISASSTTTSNLLDAL